MTTLTGLVKDASPPATDTQLSPISIPDGTTLLTTKQHNKIVDYLSGDAGPDFIPQNAIDNLVSDLAGKEDSLGFTPEDVSNKGATNGYAPLVTGLVPVANLGTGTPDGTKFLRDDGTFVVPSGLGEVNTSSNSIADSSTEKGLAKTKSGVDLPFRVVAIGSTNLSIASDSDKVTLDVLPANLSGIPQSGITDLTTDLSNKQPLDSDLTSIAGLVPVNDDIIQRKSGAWINRTPVQFKTDLALVKGDVGLGNVDNTSDADKPVSTAQQTALDLKEDSLGFTPEDVVNKSTDLTSPDNTKYPTTLAVQNELDGISPIGLHDIWFDAGGIIPVDSDALTTRIIGSGINQKAVAYIPFAASIDTFAVIKFKLPRNYNNGSLTAIFNWTTQTEGSGSVEWGISGVAVSDGDDLAGAGTNYGTEVIVVEAQTTIDFSEDTTRTGAITLANTPVDGDTIYLKIQRKGTSGSDTFPEEAQLLGVYVELTTDAAVSS